MIQTIANFINGQISYIVKFMISPDYATNRFLIIIPFGTIIGGIIGFRTLNQKSEKLNRENKLLTTANSIICYAGAGMFISSFVAGGPIGSTILVCAFPFIMLLYNIQIKAN